MGIEITSNHGGRNLDTSPPAILILLDIQRNAPQVFDKLEVYVDGGIRRGTDILKAICLGATAVSVGRTFLYALNYGQDGVEWLIDRMSHEKHLFRSTCLCSPRTTLAMKTLFLRKNKMALSLGEKDRGVSINRIVLWLTFFGTFFS